MSRNFGEIVPGDIYSVAASNIKKYRKALHMSTEELAEKVGISSEYMRRIESPKRKGGFSLAIVADISVALGIHYKLLFETEEGHNE